MDAVPDVRRCIHLDENDVCHNKSIRFDWNVAIIKMWNSGWYSFVRGQSLSLSTCSISIASSFSSVYRENIGIRSIRHWKCNKYDALIPEERRIPLTICPTIDDHDKCTAKTEHFLPFVSTSGETCFPRNRFTDSVENLEKFREREQQQHHCGIVATLIRLFDFAVCCVHGSCRMCHGRSKLHSLGKPWTLKWENRDKSVCCCGVSTSCVTISQQYVECGLLHFHCNIPWAIGVCFLFLFDRGHG